MTVGALVNDVLLAMRAGRPTDAARAAEHLRTAYLTEVESWSYTTKSGMLTVYEGHSAYWLVNNKTEVEVCIGDGVDMIFDENDDALWPGSVEFHEGLALLVEYGEADYLQGYFGE